MKEIKILKKRFYLPIKYNKFDQNLSNSNPSVNTFLQNTYGLNKSYKKYIMQRFESPKLDYVFSSTCDSFIILRILRTFISRNFNAKSADIYNLLLLYNINTYRAWRHVRGLPTRGQRT